MNKAAVQAARLRAAAIFLRARLILCASSWRTTLASQIQRV